MSEPDAEEVWAQRAVARRDPDRAFSDGYDLGLSRRAEELAANKRLLDAATAELTRLRGEVLASEARVKDLEGAVRESKEERKGERDILTRISRALGYEHPVAIMAVAKPGESYGDVLVRTANDLPGAGTKEGVR